jgi:hypothetical protein
LSDLHELPNGVLLEQRSLVKWKFLLVVLALVILLSYLLIALAHLGDKHEINFVSGVWIALAWQVNQGTIYPPVYDGQHYAGVRYMPLYFLCHAGLARLTGDYIISGKVLSLLSSVACLALIYIILRRAGCDLPAALAWTSLAVASSPMLFAGTTIRGDLLAVVWQIAACMAISLTAGSPRGAAWAALFCILAIITKITAGWALLAIGCYCLKTRWRSCIVFLAVFSVLLLAAIYVLQVASAGNMLANLLITTEPLKTRLLLLLKSPFRILFFVSRDTALLQLLIPLLVLECMRAWHQGRLSVYHMAIFFCLADLIVIFADRSTVANHLVDLVVLAVIVMGFSWASVNSKPAGTSSIRTLLLLTVLWGGLMLWARNMAHEVRDIVAAGQRIPEWVSGSYKPLANLVPAHESLFSEDAFVSVARNQAPVLLDPNRLADIARKDPKAIADLIERLRKKEFKHVVLLFRLDLDPYVNDDWYESHLGPAVAAAIRENYQFACQSDEFCIYVPRRDRAASRENGSQAPQAYWRYQLRVGIKHRAMRLANPLDVSKSERRSRLEPVAWASLESGNLVEREGYSLSLVKTRSAGGPAGTSLRSSD